MRKLVFGLLVLLGIGLVGMIVNSSKLAVARGERDRLAETTIITIKNQLEDTSKFLSKLGEGPTGPGDNQLGDFAVVKQEAQLLKNARVYESLDEAAGFRKLGFKFSDALGDLQLVLYNLDQKMDKYHYKLGDDDRKRAIDLSKAVHNVQEQLASIQEAAWQTDSSSQEVLKKYQAEAEQLSKQCKAFLEEIKKE